MNYNKDWNLEKLGFTGPEDEKIKVDFHMYTSIIKDFAKKWNIATGEVEKKFEEYMKDLDSMNRSFEFWTYLSLKTSLNSNDKKSQKVLEELGLLTEPLSELLLFTDRIDKELGSEKLIELGDKFPEYKEVLVNTANTIKYMLSDKEELACILISNALSDNIYEQYSNNLSFKMKGKDISYTEIWSLRNSEKRDVRKEAYELIATEFNQEKNKAIFENLYSKVCRSNATASKMRKLEGVMTSRNISEEMEDESVNILLKSVEDKYPLYHRFLKLKAKILGLDKLEMYDVNAPIITGEAKEMSFDEGSKFYLDTIKSIDKDIYEHSLSLYEESRIDAMPKQAKSGGAFCSYSKETGEWVLLNWDNSTGYVPTLAHELGHAYHGFLSREQNNLNYNSSLCLAETASIFNETVMFSALLEISDDKKSLICNRLNDIFATIFRQVMYVAFEKQCHESWLSNSPLSSDDYTERWISELKKLCGDNVNINDELAGHGWMNIPHIYHTPFYCYAYSFGNILSLNVYQGYKEADNKDEYLKKYKQFLTLGGSKRPKDAVKDVFELDINSDSFYDLAFNHIEELIDELEKLA